MDERPRRDGAGVPCGSGRRCRGGPTYWPIAFLLVLFAASSFAGNLIMRSFRSRDHVVLPMVRLLRSDEDLLLDAGSDRAEPRSRSNAFLAARALSRSTNSIPTISMREGCPLRPQHRHCGPCRSGHGRKGRSYKPPIRCRTFRCCREHQRLRSPRLGKAEGA